MTATTAPGPTGAGTAVTQRWRPFVGAVAVPTAAAWGVLAVLGRLPAGRRFHHESLAAGGGSAPMVLAGWCLMAVAMMLPVAAPLAAGARDAPRGVRALGAQLAGFLAPWVLVGGSAVFGDAALHAAASWAGVPAGDRTIGVVVVVTAALVHLLPWRRRCRDRCQGAMRPSPAPLPPAAPGPSPEPCRVRRANAGGWVAVQDGARSGWRSVGCCGGLMVAAFALSMGSIGGMVVLTVAMVADLHVPRARPVATIASFVVLAAAATGWG